MLEITLETVEGGVLATVITEDDIFSVEADTMETAMDAALYTLLTIISCSKTVH